MVLKYAVGGDLRNWLTNYYEEIDWRDKMKAIYQIVRGIQIIHRENVVHRDLHVGNILATGYRNDYNLLISDLGLSGDVNNYADEKKICGIIPYIAPEVLRSKPYTKAADIYSLGMIMYFVATLKQPFGDRKHDRFLALDIIKGLRPEIKEWEAPKEYIDIMKECWDSNPDNRPDIWLLLLRTNIEHYASRNIFFKDFDEDYYNENIFNSDQSTDTYSTYKSQLLNPIIEGIDDDDLVQKTPPR
jgi:serine/threonine protein kinase